MKQQLAAVGIELKPSQVSWTSGTPPRRTASSSSLDAVGLGASTDPYFTYDSKLPQRTRRRSARRHGRNYSRYSNPVVDAAAQGRRRHDGPGRQKAEYAKIQAIVADELPYIPVYVNSMLTEFNTTRVTGWPTKDNTYVPARGLEGLGRRDRPQDDRPPPSAGRLCATSCGKLAFYLVALWAALTLNFLLPRMMPGEPGRHDAAKLATQGPGHAGDPARSTRFSATDTSASLWDQYTTTWTSWSPATSAPSIAYFPAPVTEVIGQTLPWTVVLVGLATVISFVLGIALGALRLEARHLARQPRAGDHVPAVDPVLLARAAVAVPLGSTLAVFPIVGGYDVYSVPPGWSWAFFASALYHAILPALTIVISSVGGWLLGMRNMMVSTLSEDYVVTAEAKGLHPAPDPRPLRRPQRRPPATRGLRDLARLRRRRLDRDRAGVQLPGHRRS